GRRVRAASAETGAARDRFLEDEVETVARSEQAAAPALAEQGLRRAPGEVLAPARHGGPGLLARHRERHSPAGARSRLDAVGEGEREHPRAQLVVAVLAPAEHLEPEVDLGGRERADELRPIHRSCRSRLSISRTDDTRAATRATARSS